MMAGYEVIGYEIYICPENQNETGKYYGKTPILEQARAIVANAKKDGLNLFIKEVGSDGRKRYL